MAELKNDSKDFSKGKISRHILEQSVPLILAQFVSLLYNIIDRIYLGHLSHTGSAALTGVGIVFPLISLIMAFTNLFAFGGAPLSSIERGKKNDARAEHIMGNTFTALLVTSVAVMLVGYLLEKPILYLFGASDVTYPYAHQYLSIYLLGTFFYVIGTGMNAFINAQGFAKTGMASVMVGAVFNIGLDPVFIFALHMGVRGAAIATVISQFVSCVWVVHFLTGKKAILKLKKKYLRPEWKLEARIMMLGLAGFMASATNGIVQVVCNATLSIYGGDVFIAVMTIVNSVRDIVQLPITGITQGGQPVMGYNYGAGENKRVRESIRVVFWMSMAYAVIMWAVVMLFPQIFIHLFTTDVHVVDNGIHGMRLYFLAFFFMVFQMTGQSTFVAVGDSRHAVFFSTLRKLIIVVPLTILLPRVAGLGTSGVFLAEPVSNVIGGLACFATMMAVVWKRKLADKDAS